MIRNKYFLPSIEKISSSQQNVFQNYFRSIQINIFLQFGYLQFGTTAYIQQRKTHEEIQNILRS